MEYKAIVKIPGWAQDMIDGEVENKYKLFSVVPILYRAVHIRANALARVPVDILNANGEKIEWPFETSIYDLLWKTEASMLLAGAAYIEKVRRRISKRIADLRWLNPTPITVNYDENGMVFERNGNKFTEDDIIYIREFSISDDIRPGVSALQAALSASSLLHYSAKFAENFFKSGAMPVTLVYAEGVTSQEQERVQSFLRRVMNGVGNAWRMLVLNRKLEPHVISQPISEMAMSELNELAIRNVSYAFGIPESMLRYDPNRATSQEQRLSFYQDTIEPHAKFIIEQINAHLKPIGLHIVLNFNELDVYQEDENSRATSLANIVGAISTNPQAAQFAMRILGYDLDEEERNMLEEIVRGAKEREQAQSMAQAQTQQQNNLDSRQAQEQSNASPSEETQKMIEDLEKWRKKAKKRFAKDGKADCPFESAYIPSEVRMRIARQLPACKSLDDIDAVFDVEKSVDFDDAQAILEAVKAEMALIVSRSEK